MMNSNAKVDGENRAKRPWTPQEEETLSKLVAQHGPRNWNEISAAVPGRSRASCYLRWLNKLSPDVGQLPFTPAEDNIIMLANAIHGNQWATFPRLLPGRTNAALKKRWNSTLRHSGLEKGYSSSYSDTAINKKRTTDDFPLRSDPFDFPLRSDPFDFPLRSDPFKRHYKQNDSAENNKGSSSGSAENINSIPVTTTLSLRQLGEEKIKEEEEEKRDEVEGRGEMVDVEVRWGTVDGQIDLRELIRCMIAEEVRRYFDDLKHNPPLPK